MSSALGEVILGLCASAIRLNNRFAMEHALCLAILHSNVGQEIGEWKFVSIDFDLFFLCI